MFCSVLISEPPFFGICLVCSRDSTSRFLLQFRLPQTLRVTGGGGIVLITSGGICFERVPRLDWGSLQQTLDVFLAFCRPITIHLCPSGMVFLRQHCLLEPSASNVSGLRDENYYTSEAAHNTFSGSKIIPATLTDGSSTRSNILYLILSFPFLRLRARLPENEPASSCFLLVFNK